MKQQDFTCWESSYSVGNWVLDNQHKVILSLCRDAIESVPYGDQGIATHFHLIRDELIDSVENHFGTEETLLRHCRYPLLENHREEHSEFQIRLTKFLAATASGRIKQADLHQFLSQWWFEHILSSDKKFAGSIHRVR